MNDGIQKAQNAITAGHGLPKSKLCRKYILYNLCFLLIPIISFLGIYLYTAERQVMRDLRASSEFALRQTMRVVDSNVVSLSSFAYQLSSDGRISPYFLRRGNYRSVEAISQLKLYATQFGFLDSLLVSVEGDGVLYSGRGTTSFATVFGQRHTAGGRIYRPFGAWTADDIREMILTGNPTDSFPAGCGLKNADGDLFFLIVCPWKSASSIRVGSVAGLVNQRYFQEILNGNRSEIDHATYIFDAGGNLVASHVQNLEIDDGQAANLAALCVGDQEVAAGKNQLLYARSDVNGWLYMTVLPDGATRMTVLSANWLLLLITGIVTFVLVLIGIWFAYQTYQPIRDLYSRVDEDALAAGRSEFEAIDRYITKIVDNNTKIRDQLEKSEEYETQLLLQKIISGNTSVEKLEKENQKIRLLYPTSAIAVVKTQNRIEPTRREKVFFEPLSRIECVYATEMMYKDYVAILVNARDQAHYHQLLRQIYDSVSASCGCNLVIGAGSMCQNIKDLKHSLTEAVIAIEYGRTGDLSHILYYESMHAIQPGDFMTYIHSLHMKLAESLRRRDAAIAETTLDQLRAIAGEEQDETRIRYLVSSLIFCLMSAAEEVHLSGRREKILELEACDHLDAFFYRVQSRCEEIMECYSRQARESQLSLYDRIRGYIDENYRNMDLSLTGIAEIFEITPSYLSRFFRETHGATFIDYLTEKRMSEAKRLLESTDDKIQIILEKVGYLDIASFSRKFKQLYGVSPGKYREMHHNTP